MCIRDSNKYCPDQLHNNHQNSGSLVAIVNHNKTPELDTFRDALQWNSQMDRQLSRATGRLHSNKNSKGSPTQTWHSVYYSVRLLLVTETTACTSTTLSICPVSYTHLDVYKRQVVGLQPLTFTVTLSYVFHRNFVFSNSFFTLILMEKEMNELITW